MKKIYLLDAYALIYRAYYAFMSRPMRNRLGENTSAVFGFTKFLRDIIMRERPDYLGVAFDPKGGSFRNEIYPEYKANRSETPEDIVTSIPYIKRILEAMHIPILEVKGYEADDVIGTLSVKAAQAGFEVLLVTPDKDFGQLIQPNVRIYKQSKSGEGVDIVGCEELKAGYGIDDPRLIIDILALWGDASDNIPGVPGIGEKSAVKLVNELGTVENILVNTDKLKGKQKENILANSEQLKLAKRLATICTDVPIEFDPDKLAVEDPDCDALRGVYRELDFNMFIREMETSDESPFSAAVKSSESAAVSHAEGVVLDLFGTPVPSPAKRKIPTVQQISANRLPAAAQEYQTIDTTPHSYHTVTETKELRELAKMLSESERFCFDVESTGFDCFGSSIVGISFAVKEREAYYIPVNKSNESEVFGILRPVFEDERIAKIGQNIKFDIMMLAAAEVEVRGHLVDTMILHYLLDPESRHNMNHLARTYLDYSPIEIGSLIGRGSKQLTMDRVPVDIVSEYGGEDADVTLRLYNVLEPKIREAGLWELYCHIEEPLIRVLADMEMTGVKIDVAELNDYGQELSKTMASIEAEIQKIAEDNTLNVNSSRQLGALLFEKLKIDTKPKRTKTKQYSTDEEYLQTLSSRHPVVGLILEYRGVKKLLSTYIEALPALVNPHTGRVHTSYNQTVTATGRLSSTNPNLQNIPIRDEQGRRIREAFVPSGSDYVLLSADYSQVELRIMAHLSGDENMINAFRQGADIHSATAALLFGIPESDVTPDMRRKAKTANFGIIYGISAFGLKQRMNDITMAEAKAIIDGYFVSYPGVKRYMDSVIEDAREKGYVETIFGRRRWLPDIRSANSTVRSLAERNAINAPIQGSAADVIKIAMNNIHAEFRKRGLRSKLILQVHDELVIDVLRTELEEVTQVVRESMEKAAELSVRLTVDCGTGDNWLQAH